MRFRVRRRVIPGVLAANLGIVSVGLLATPALRAQAPPDCAQWNTEAYFRWTRKTRMAARLCIGRPNTTRIRR